MTFASSRVMRKSTASDGDSGRKAMRIAAMIATGALGGAAALGALFLLSATTAGRIVFAETVRRADIPGV